MRVVPTIGMSRLGWINGLSETVDGVWAWLQSWPQVETRSLWRWRIRPPLRQDMACLIVKCSRHPSQRGGREVGFRPRRRRAPSRNSSADRSEPLSKLGKVVSHAPVDAERFFVQYRANRNVTDRPRSYLDKSRRENNKYIETYVN